MNEIHLSRRTFAQLAAGTALVAGLDIATGRWVAAAEEPAAPGEVEASGGLERLPRLDGQMLFDDASRATYAQDFGQIIHETPLAVLLPGSVDDIRRVIRFAGRHGIRIVGRGTAHTVYGQAQVAAGVVIDMSALSSIRAQHPDRITVDAGLRWNALLEATLAQGRMPPVLPDYIGQTVGGTLSVGGIGGATHRFGAQIDHVLELKVVTGNGDLLTCSPRRHSRLFEAVLAGQGQVAVIVEATLSLVAAPATVRLYNLFYPDVPGMLADVGRLTADERFDQLEAWVVPDGNGGWLHYIEAIAFHSPAGPPDEGPLLAGLSHLPEAAQSVDLGFSQWSNRVPTDLPVRPNPWIDLWVPMSASATFLAEVQASIRPVADGDLFSILLIPAKAANASRPLFRLPAEDVALGLGILRFAPPDPAGIATILAFNRSIYDRNHELGGSHYPISALDLTRDDWERHYGPEWPRLEAAKHRYDRHNVLAGGPDIFGY